MCYLFVLSIAVCFEAFRGVQLDGGAADHLDAALLVLHTQGSYTAVHLRGKHVSLMCLFLYYFLIIGAFGKTIKISDRLWLKTTTCQTISTSHPKSNSMKATVCVVS